MLPAHIDFNNVALILIDLQKGYCKPTSDCAQAPLNWDVNGADAVCKSHADFLMPARKILPPENIIWTQMEEHPDTYAENSPARYDDGFVDLCVRGTEGHEFHHVTPQEGEAILFKTHPSAFHHAAKITTAVNKGDSLDTYLKKLGVEGVAFTGVVEPRCVHYTMSGASERGFYPMAIRGLMASPFNKAGGPDFDTESSVVRDSENRFITWSVSAQKFLDHLKAA